MSASLYLVAGLGKTGHSIARYLSKRNKAFVAFDTRSNPEGLAAFKAEFPGVDIFLGAIPLGLYAELCEIICSPGVALDEPSIRQALDQGISVVGDIECLAREIKRPVIAITGTNGKSTVTTLVGEMAKASGMSVAVAGNIGAPVLDLLDDSIDYDLWVLELSSFQLDLVSSLAPIAATILNVTPDHLDRHHDMMAYIRAKQRVYHQSQALIYNREDNQTIPQLSQVSPTARQVSYGLDSPTEHHWGLTECEGVLTLCQGADAILPADSIKIKGRHNWQNALAACALAREAGIQTPFMVSVLQSFAGLPHRSQWVRTLEGVEWINDSKGTNIGATISAISGLGGSLKGQIVLIAGGQGKGADFSELRGSIAEFVRAIVLIGQDADLLEKALGDLVPIIRASTLDEAVLRAKTCANPGDVVLLSPACASLDMFKDFNHRGESFSAAVNAL
jgi:UDP-N-acetylmuramoylalanine--D-glutamate ligase